MKILVLAESLRINETSSGIVSSTFIEALIASGYEINVLTPNNFNYEVSWLSKDVVLKFEIPEFKMNWYHKIPKFIAIYTYLTGLHFKSHHLKSVWKIQIKKAIEHINYDYIYVLGSGSEFLAHMAISELDIKIPYIANFHDPFPWHVYPEPYKQRKTMVGILLKFRTRKIINKSYKISFPSFILMEHMRNYFNFSNDKSFVIPHLGLQLKNLPDTDSNLIFNAHEINIVHAGTLLGPRNPRHLILAITELKKESPLLLNNVKFIFLGKIAKELKEIAKKNINENVVFNDFRVSYKKSLEIIRVADASMVIEAAADFSPFMPGKIADIVFYNKPILALTPSNSEVSRLLGSNYKYKASLNNIKEIKFAISALINDIHNSEIDLNSIHNIKQYVSLEENKKMLKRILI